MASLISQLHEIIEFSYNITDISKFSEDHGKSLNLSSEEIMTYFKIIESTDDMPVEASTLKVYYSKPITIKNFQKVFNIHDCEYKASGSDIEFVSYQFFKRFLASQSFDKWTSLQKIESIISVDVIKKSIKLSPVTKAKNIFLGCILESTEDNCIKLEFIKMKKTKLNELPELVKDKKIVLQFTFDKDVDSIKVFSDSVKTMFLEKVDIIDRKKEREIDSQNIKIKESLDSMDKEERKSKEKIMLLKHSRVTMKSLNIQIKSNLVVCPDNSFTTEEVVTAVTQGLSKYLTVDIIQSDNTSKEEQGGVQGNDSKEVQGERDEEHDEEQADESDQSDAESDDDSFGL